MHTAAMVAETDGGGDPKWMVYNVIFWYCVLACVGVGRLTIP